MDKLAIVIGNYIDVDCDANTAPRQAYERGFRRATEKCETVMRSRKIENDQLEAENASLRGAAQGLGELCDRYKAENERLEKRLAQYGLFNEVVGDPAHEFASLRRRLHNIERENEKLRELVRDLHTCLWHPTCREECRLFEFGRDHDDSPCNFDARMRELGIEVKDEH